MTAPSEPNLRMLTTPKAAALAGVVFALLFGTVLILIRTKMPEDMEGTVEWLENRRSGIAAATVLMPFAGISFLWFIGVVRDGFGRYEDRFFSTVFLGSGLLFLAMMFVSMSVAAGLVATISTETADWGKMILLASSKTYAVRMAAVFMMSLATIWLRTGLMPRWLVGISYLSAVGLLVASDISMWVTMAFPIWVLAVSGLILARSGLFEKLRNGDD